MSFRYFTAHLLTRERLADFLPLSDVSLTDPLRGIGECKASVNLAAPSLAGVDMEAATDPDSTALFVEVTEDINGDPVRSVLWGGPIDSRSYKRSTRSFALSASQYESLFALRFAHLTRNRKAVDQLVLAREWLADAQASPGGNFGVVAAGTESSGVPRDRVHAAYELPNVLGGIEAMATADRGFDYGIDVRLDALDRPQPVIVFSYPERTSGAGHVLLELGPDGGNIADYSWPESAAPSRSFATGQGGDVTLLTYATDPAVDAGQRVLREQSISYSDAALTAAYLQARANADERAARRRATTIIVELAPGLPLSSYIVGDRARLRIRDERFPAGIDLAGVRIVQRDVRPPARGAGLQVTLTLDLAA